MDKRYMPRTFGMRYKEFSPILASQVRLVKDCKGYEAFKEDVKILREARSNCGKASIFADHFMKMICNAKKKNLIKFVDKYEKGTLNPYLVGNRDELELDKK